MSAAALWTAVKARYDSDGLITLTNVRDRAATAIDDTAGQQAAQDVIDLFPAYAQETYDAADALHIQAGVLAVIAVLWRRGGTASSIEQVKWEEVFGDEGVITRLKNTNARARAMPSTNAGTRPSTELLQGQRRLPWSDPSTPFGNLPRAHPYNPEV